MHSRSAPALLTVVSGRSAAHWWSGQIQTETADQFILSAQTSITQATFTGLIPSGANITNVEIEFYHVFPKDSANPPSGNILTRNNSPADVEIAAATRDAAAGSLSFSSSVLNPSFTVANSVVNGINKQPNQTTGGEGAATGQEVRISVNFLPSVDLPADHFFLRPEAALSSGNFLLLSAAGPAVFTGDLQTWIRNDNLAPDWERVGTDVTHQGPFNASFSLTGVAVPGPIAGAGLPGLIWRVVAYLAGGGGGRRWSNTGTDTRPSLYLLYEICPGCPRQIIQRSMFLIATPCVVSRYRPYRLLNRRRANVSLA